MKSPIFHPRTRHEILQIMPAANGWFAHYTNEDSTNIDETMASPVVMWALVRTWTDYCHADNGKRSHSDEPFTMVSGVTTDDLSPFSGASICADASNFAGYTGPGAPLSTLRREHGFDEPQEHNE